MTMVEAGLSTLTPAAIVVGEDIMAHVIGDIALRVVAQRIDAAS
jgi:hypothetical protein